MKRRVFITAVTSAVALSALLWAYYRHSRIVQDRLESRVASGAASIDFAAETTFPWDRMYVFGPYTSRAEAEKALGFRWSGYRYTGMDSNDSDCLVVFVHGKSVVFWYKQPRRTVELGYLPSPNGYGRLEATFLIDRSYPARPTLRVAQPATSTAPSAVGSIRSRSTASEVIARHDVIVGRPARGGNG